VIDARDIRKREVPHHRPRGNPAPNESGNLIEELRRRRRQRL
jgi:hypothetical protein